MKVTEVDRQVLGFVRDFWPTHGRGPTLQEIATEFGWGSPASAQRHVDALIVNEELDRDRAGGLRTPGQIAGAPCIAQVMGEKDRWVPAPAPFLKAWVARRPSEGIATGDLVFVSFREEPLQGELCLFGNAAGRFVIERLSGTVRAIGKGERQLDGTEGLRVVGPLRFIQRAVVPPRESATEAEPTAEPSVRIP